MSQKTGSTLRIVAIVLVAASAAFTLLGGAGTTCVAFNAAEYGNAFKMFIPFAPTYQLFVYISLVTGIASLGVAFAMMRWPMWGTVITAVLSVVSIAAGLIMSKTGLEGAAACVVAVIAGIALAYVLARAYKWAYWAAIGTVAISAGVAAAHMYYTSTLKLVSFFATPPESMRFYVSVLTLVVLLVLRLPGIWKWVDFTQPWPERASKSTAGGVTAIMMGIIALSTPMWAGANHVVDGYNLVYVLEIPLAVGGWSLVLAGMGALITGALGISRQAALQALRRRFAFVRTAS